MNRAQTRSRVERELRSDGSDPAPPSRTTYDFVSESSSGELVPTSFVATEDERAGSPANTDARTEPSRTSAPITISTATLVLAVYQDENAKASLRTTVAAQDGYIALEQDTRMVLRVPAAAFDATLEALASVGEVRNRAITATDVTDEYSDLEVRVRNLQQVRIRLEAVLARATSIEDTLRVENELRRITEELERLEGQQRLMQDRIAFSTITVTLVHRTEDQPARGVNLPFAWLEELGLARLLAN